MGDLGVILINILSWYPKSIPSANLPIISEIGKIRRHLTKESCATVVQSLVVSRPDCNSSLLYRLPGLHLHLGLWLELAVGITSLQYSSRSISCQSVRGSSNRFSLSPSKWFTAYICISYQLILGRFAHTICPTGKDLLCVPKVSKTIGPLSFAYTAPIVCGIVWTLPYTSSDRNLREFEDVHVPVLGNIQILGNIQRLTSA